jgi:hypothetical protein
VRPPAEQRYRDAAQREETTRLENDRHTDAMKVAAPLQFIDERDVAFWHFSEALDRRAKVCLSEKCGRTRERARIPPLTRNGCC